MTHYKTDDRPRVLQDEKVAGRRNFFSDDETLHKILESQLEARFFNYAKKELATFGERCANEIDERAKHTDREGEPRLLKYDRYGEEISEVWVNEGYKQTVQETYDSGIVGYVHKEIPELKEKGNYTYSFAQGYVLSQSEPGFYCPVTLTLATAFLLDHYGDEAVKERFLKNVCATGDVPLFEGATFLTERQGGSDVGANVVEAVKDGDNYRLYGEKYFASNAGMCGVAMVLARIEGAPSGSRGLTLFAVPWRMEDGTLNRLRIRRLKDKLGVRAVPSGEVEFNGSIAYMVGDPSKGFYYMMEALNLSRVANAVASVGIMRRAYIESIHYASRRTAFGKRLTEFPMVQDSLGRLKAKLHAELATVFDLISLFDKVTNDRATETEIVLNRLKIAIIKKETAEQAIHFCHEAIEMHGGNGYIEDFVTPRLLRDAQVLTVWEGTANILGLELVRLVNKYAAHTIFIEHIEARLSTLNHMEGALSVRTAFANLKKDLYVFSELDEEVQTFEAKQLMERMALLYESVVVLEWAKKHRGTYALLAEIYMHMTWKNRTIGGEMLTVKYFEEIVQTH